MKLHQLISQYVAFRKSMGEKFNTCECVLKAFCRAMGDQVDINDVRADRVVTFLAGAGPVTSHWHRKHTTLRGFYRYAISRGWVISSPLPTVVPQLPARFVPYIYTHDDLFRLLNATASYQRRHVLLEPHTFRAILLLLYGAGLRLSEALSLWVGDVDLPVALITIRNTKFYKSRIVPLGPQLNQAMVRYAKNRKEAGHSQSKSAPFFVGCTGAPLKTSTVQQAFLRLRAHAGIRRTDGARYQPRLHDLRHAFAVNRLTAWYKQGADVQTQLAKLSTYLGHISIASTQVYLTMTPTLLGEASIRFSQYANKEGYHD